MYKVLEVSPTAKCLPGISTEPVLIVTEEFITDRRLGTVTILDSLKSRTKFTI